MGSMIFDLATFLEEAGVGGKLDQLRPTQVWAHCTWPPPLQLKLVQRSK
jgi:hypothetical protein